MAAGVRAEVPVRLRARAVALDFNGTLADDEPVLASIFCELLAERGLTLTPDTYMRELAGLSDREITVRGLSLRGREPTAPEVDAMLAERADRYRRRAALHSPLRPEAAELVRTLAARIPVAVVSGAARSEVEMALDGAGLRPLLSACVCGEDVRAGKPDPEGYLRALDALGRAPGGGGPIRAADVVAIEDSPAGLDAARAAGMRCLAITGTAPIEALVTRADGVLHSLATNAVMGLLDV
ncbi:MAG: HAD family hydrolase [Solirubrobacteraceae bacterium]